MNNYLLRLSKAELTGLLENERKKFLKALEYDSPASHLEEIRDTIRSIQAALENKESDSNQC
jgi:hypothetical protein